MCEKSKREAKSVQMNTANLKKIKIIIDDITYRNFKQYRDDKKNFSDKEIIKQLFQLAMG